MPAEPHGSIFWRAPARVRRPRRARPWLGLGLVLAIVAYLLVFGDTGWLAVRAEERAVADLQAELDLVRAQADGVQGRNEELLREGSEELERIAREQYRMRREGEEVHHLVGGTDEAASSTPPPAPRP